MQSHWQLLGVDRGAKPKEMRRAYREKSRRFDPDRYGHIADPDFQDKISFIYTRLAEAFATLSKQAAAQRYDELVSKEQQYEEQKKAWALPARIEEARSSTKRGDREKAKGLYQRAKKAYEKNDYWDAIQLCRHAIELGDAEPDCFHLLGLALAHNPRWRLDAEKNLKIAANLQPWQAKHLVALGELYRREGLHGRARKMFQQARAIDPKQRIPSNGS